MTKPNPFDLAINTAKKNTPPVVNTPRPLQSQKLAQPQQPQAPTTNVNPVSTAIKSAINVKQPDIKKRLSTMGGDIVLRGKGLEEIKTTYPEFGHIDDETFKKIGGDIALRGKGVDDILKDYPQLQGKKKAGLLENIDAGLIKSATAIPELAMKATDRLFGTIDKFVVDPISKAMGVDEEKIAKNTGIAQDARNNVISGTQNLDTTLKPNADRDSIAYQGAKLVGDIGQSALLPGAKVTKGAGALKTAGQFLKQGALESGKYKLIADKELPSVKELGIGAVANLALGSAGNGLKMLSKLKKPEAVTKLVGKITQLNDPKKLERASKALTKLEIPKNPTYETLVQSANKAKTSFMNQLDDKLTQSTKVFTPANSTKQIVSTATGKIRERNYIDDAITYLKELYDNQGLDDMFLKVDDLEEAYRTRGLSHLEVNKLAKMYGAENKAFTRLGDKLSSKVAGGHENVRKGIKDMVREGMDEDILKLDKDYSDMEMLSQAFEDMTKKVTATSNRTVKPSIGNQVGNIAGKILDTATLGTAGGVLKGLTPSNVGNKILNNLGVQEKLGSNLSKFAKQLKPKAKLKIPNLRTTGVKLISKDKKE